ncbi:hypothetical protein C8Q76DRAFT_789301 [Earliella scabrosa]|nr:hypothetical protein C8Q76DRAFT_789301 [Earliella scabrosa]
MAYYGSWCHRALYCVDILEAVLTESLERNEDTSMNCNTCVQAALVCRSFSETALRLVWRTLPDLNPLWKLFHQTTNIMHGSTFEATQGNGSRSTFWDDETWRMRPYSMIISERRHSDPVVWARFLNYAQHVRHIQDANCMYCEGTDVDPNLILALTAHNGGSTFLPALRSLRWYQSPSAGRALLKLACPSLTTLELQHHSQFKHDRQEDLADVLALLPSTFPALRSLHIDGFLLLNPPTSTVFYSSIPSFQNLRKLGVTASVTWDDLHSFIAPLEELQLRFTGPDTWSDRGTLLAPNLQILTSPKLDAVRLKSYADSEFPQAGGDLGVPYPDVTAVLDALTTSQPSICNLALEMCVEINSDNDTDKDLIHDVLYPCLKLSQLKQLEVIDYSGDEEPQSLYYSDKGILSLAQNLKHLTRLQLPDYFYKSPSQSMSLASLVPLSLHCPQLTHLCLGLDTLLPTGPAPVITLPPPEHLHPLKILMVGLPCTAYDSATIAECARVLHRLFPALDIDDSRARSLPLLDELWDELERVQLGSST